MCMCARHGNWFIQVLDLWCEECEPLPSWLFCKDLEQVLHTWLLSLQRCSVYGFLWHFCTLEGHNVKNSYICIVFVFYSQRFLCLPFCSVVESTFIRSVLQGLTFSFWRLTTGLVLRCIQAKFMFLNCLTSVAGACCVRMPVGGQRDNKTTVVLFQFSFILLFSHLSLSFSLCIF